MDNNYNVKIVNKKDSNDIASVRLFPNRIEAQAYYNIIKNNATANKSKVIRQANEALDQCELTYEDAKILLCDNDKIILKFIIG